MTDKFDLDAKAGRPRESGQRGFALLLVLWTLVLLALIITHLLTAGRTELRIAANLRANAEARAAADGAVNEALFRLNDGSARSWAADGRTRRLDWPGVRIDVRLESLAGKVNPNIAPAALLAKLLRLVASDLGGNGGDPDMVAAAIVAWRSPTASQQRAVLLAQYRAAGLAYGPPGAPFQTLDEIGRVLGMTPELLGALRRHLSLFPQGPPDESLADPVVAAALRYSAPGEHMQQPLDPTGLATLPIIAIEAQAVTKEGARFTRTAIARLDPALPHGGTVLAWGTDLDNIE